MGVIQKRSRATKTDLCTRTPPLAPGKLTDDVTIHIVLNDFGEIRKGVYREDSREVRRNIPMKARSSDQQLVLILANKSRGGAHWSPDDYDVRDFPQPRALECRHRILCRSLLAPLFGRHNRQDGHLQPDAN